MPFQPGESGNPDGRPKGSENKTRAQLREKITEFLLNNFDAVIEEVNSLPVEQKLKFYFMLLPYGLSKKKEDPPVEKQQEEEEQQQQEEDVWTKLDKMTAAELDEMRKCLDPYKPNTGNGTHAEEINKTSGNVEVPPQEKGG